MAKYFCLCLQPEHVASISTVCSKKDDFTPLTDYEGLPLVIDCKLVRIASNPGQYSASCRVVLVICDLVLVERHSIGTWPCRASHAPPPSSWPR